MKNFKGFAIARTGIISIIAIGVVLFSISSIEKDKELMTYKTLESRVIFRNTGGSVPWRMIANAVSCEGSFEIDDHQLINLSGLSFEIPISQFKSGHHQIEAIISGLFKLNNCERIAFKQKFGMVLPVMQKIHVIGEANILNGIHTAPMQVDYELNADNTLRIRGKQSFSLRQFGVKVPPHLTGMIDDEIEFEIDFLLETKVSEL